LHFKNLPGAMYRSELKQDGDGTLGRVSTKAAGVTRVGDPAILAATPTRTSGTLRSRRAHVGCIGR